MFKYEDGYFKRNINGKYVNASAVDMPISLLLTAWEDMIEEHTNKTIKLYAKREAYKVDSDKVLEEAKKIKDETEVDIIKDKYGGNNDKTRKRYVKDKMAEANMEIKNLEWSIDYLSKEIVFIKELIRTKRVLMEIKE